MRRAFLLAAVWSAVWFVSRLALADAETVHLANGSIYAGELVEKVPGDHVTIKLATGEIRKFEWAEIASDNVQSIATAPGAPVVVAPPVTPPPPPRPAKVKFNSDSKGALLVRIDNSPIGKRQFGVETEMPVCYAPCSADVDANARYYVRGAYITRSADFAIPDGESTLMARTGSSTATTAGAWMLFFGVVSTITGAISTPIAFIDNKASTGWNGWQYFGVTSLIAGGAFILLAVPFLVAGRTHVGMGDMDVARSKWLPGGFRF